MRRYGRYRRRRSTTYKAKRRSYGRSRYNRRRLRIPRAFPTSRAVKLVYDDVFYLNSAALVPAINTFRLNSIYDPDQTGIGGVPSGASNWAGMFTMYKVMGAKVQVKFIANCNQALIAGFHVYGSNSLNYSTPGTGTAVQQVLTELPNSAFKMIGPANLSTANAVGYISRYYSMKQILGSEAYHDSLSSSRTNDVPTIGAYMDLMITDALTATTGNVAFANVRVTYYVKFYQPDLDYTD